MVALKLTQLVAEDGKIGCTPIKGAPGFWSTQQRWQQDGQGQEHKQRRSEDKGSHH